MTAVAFVGGLDREEVAVMPLPFRQIRVGDLFEGVEERKRLGGRQRPVGELRADIPKTGIVTVGAAATREEHQGKQQENRQQAAQYKDLYVIVVEFQKVRFFIFCKDSSFNPGLQV